MRLKIFISLALIALTSACAAPGYHQTKKAIKKPSAAKESVISEDKLLLRLQDISLKIQNAGIEQCGKIRQFNNGCVYEFDMLDDTSAYTTPGKIHINKDILTLTKTEDELSAIMGYAYAYNVLKNNSPNPSYNKADYLGLYITALAEFNITNAPDFLQKLSSQDKIAEYISLGKISGDRQLAMVKTVTEIKKKQNNGLVLNPNWKE